MKFTEKNEKVEVLYGMEQVKLLPNPEKTRKLVKALTSMYSNPFTWVQELVCNAIDSNVEAGIKANVIVDAVKTIDGYNIVITDFGVGIDPDRAIFTYTLLESSREESNDFIGGWGMGSKSPFAYTNSFVVESIKNEVYYKYVVFLQDGFILLNQLHEEEAKGKINQTNITVNIKENDLNRVQEIINNKLLFLDNLLVLGDLKPPPKTYKGEHYCIGLDEQVLLVGNIPYYIPFYISSKFGNFQVRVEIGEVEPTITREALEWTEDLKTLVKQKYETAEQKLEELIDSQTLVTDDFFEALNSYRNNNHVEINGLKIYCSKYPKKVILNPLTEESTFHFLKKCADLRITENKYLKTGRRSKGKDLRLEELGGEIINADDIYSAVFTEFNLNIIIKALNSYDNLEPIKIPREKKEKVNKKEQYFCRNSNQYYTLEKLLETKKKFTVLISTDAFHNKFNNGKIRILKVSESNYKKLWPYFEDAREFFKKREFRTRLKRDYDSCKKIYVSREVKKFLPWIAARIDEFNEPFRGYGTRLENKVLAREYEYYSKLADKYNNAMPRNADMDDDLVLIQLKRNLKK